MTPRAHLASKAVAMLALCAAGLFGADLAQAASPAFGRWKTHNDTAIVRIYQCGQKLCGAIDKVLDPAAPDNDANNPDPRQRSNKLVGTLILRDYTQAGAYWKNGRAYDPRSGSSYRSQLVVLKDGRLKLTGCVLMLCGSKYWTRAD